MTTRAVTVRPPSLSWASSASSPSIRSAKTWPALRAPMPAPFLLVSATATLFGAWTRSLARAHSLPSPSIWEFSFGAYMTFKGFRSTEHGDEARAPLNPATVAGVGA